MWILAHGVDIQNKEDRGRSLQYKSKASLTFGQIVQLLLTKMEKNWTFVVATNVQKYRLGTNLAPLGCGNIPAP